MIDKNDLKTLAIVPARSNSKRVPGKNLKKLGGIPLFLYTLSAALNSSEIDLVCLTTESFEIEQAAIDFAKQVNKLDKLDIIHRAMYLTMDHVQLDEVCLAALRQYELNGYSSIETVVVLQPTSPFRTTKDIDDAVRILNASPNANTVFSAFAANGFYWEWDHESGGVVPVGHTPHNRLGGQWEWANRSIVKENGALYVTRYNQFTHTKSFRNAPYAPIIIQDGATIDIDTHSDWSEAEQYLQSKLEEM